MYVSRNEESRAQLPRYARYASRNTLQTPNAAPPAQAFQGGFPLQQGFAPPGAMLGVWPGAVPGHAL
ncbi:hypothetical protein WJX81_002554 [Elliptochloris bilobata]|uniref:Uncharacterized protein n=1 Tax=Elliptochloris bilobata TaxID=381761 RepID=A0AAW1QZ55_9CHLO